jgi:hypothetical protein
MLGTYFQLLILNLTVAFRFPKCLGFMWLLFCQSELVVLGLGARATACRTEQKCVRC